MAHSLYLLFEREFQRAQSLLEPIDEEAAGEPYRPGGWLRKQVLGHLLDSAANNHIRFVFAALKGSYEGPVYDQTRWVDLNGYAQEPWEALLREWKIRNERLLRLVGRIPEAALAAQCRVGGGEPVTLQFLIEDYLVHLLHHAEAIRLSRAAALASATSRVRPRVRILF